MNPVSLKRTKIKHIDNRRKDSFQWYWHSECDRVTGKTSDKRIGDVENHRRWWDEQYEIKPNEMKRKETWCKRTEMRRSVCETNEMKQMCN